MKKFVLWLAIFCLLLPLPSSATTLVFDGEIFAGDTQVTSGMTALRGGTKIFYSPKRHAYIGCAGSVSLINKVVHWFLTATTIVCPVVAPKDSEQTYAYIIVTEHGKTIYHDSMDGMTEEYEVKGPIALGSGEDFARAAMLLGLSAPEAILVASALDLATNSFILYYDVVAEDHQLKSFDSRSVQKH